MLLRQSLNLSQREATQPAVAAFGLKVPSNHYLSSINLTADAALPLESGENPDLQKKKA